MKRKDDKGEIIKKTMKSQHSSLYMYKSPDLSVDQHRPIHLIEPINQV